MHFLSTSTSDGIILQGLMRNSKKPSKKLIIHIHGMSGNFFESSFIKTMFQNYPDNGIDFLSVETRGSELMRWFTKKDGTLTLIGNAYELFEDCDKDILAWLKFAEKNYKDIYLQGHSLGCSKIAYTVTKHKTNVKGILLISPADMHGLRLNRDEAKDHKKRLNEALTLKKKGKGGQLLSGLLWDYAVLSADSYLSIFGENTKIFNFFNPEFGFKTVNKINIPMMAIVGTKDFGICTEPYKTMKKLQSEAKKCPKFKGFVYRNAKHDFDGFEKSIIKDVIQFIEAFQKN